MNDINGVPLSLIKQIITDGDLFMQFLHREEAFKNVNVDDYIDAINKYMDDLVQNNTCLTQTYFSRINYINHLFKTGITYNYNVYLDKQKSIVTNDDINNILTNEEILNKFLDFDNHKSSFNNIPIGKYLEAMDNMITYNELNNIKLPDNMLNNFKKIMSKYSLLLKKKHILVGEVVKEPLDEELEKEILKNVDLRDSKFSIALAIYVNICKLVSFDVNYVAYNKDFENEIVKQISQLKVSQITLKNNSVVCHSWSRLYASILNKLAVEATVAGDIHKYVFLNADGTLIRADATNRILGYEGLKTYDIARVQMGFVASGFICPEKHKDIRNDIKRTYLKYNYQHINRKQLVESIPFQKDKLKMLKDLCKKNMQNSELQILIKMALKFTGDEGIESFYIGLKVDDKFFTPKLLIYYNNIYYLLDKYNINMITMETLKSLIENDKIRFLNKNKLPELNDKTLQKRMLP